MESEIFVHDQLKSLPKGCDKMTGIECRANEADVRPCVFLNSKIMERRMFEGILESLTGRIGARNREFRFVTAVLGSP